jgi:fructose-1,6-bisphosphatase/inositol monophosphatase family enzyme
MSTYDAQKECAIELAKTISKIEMKHFGEETIPAQHASLDTLVRGYRDTRIRAVEHEAQEDALRVLQKRFPNHHVCANKHSFSLDFFEDNPPDPCWLIDTLDGGRQYSEGNQHFGATIGYRENGEFSVSVICLPAHNTLYVATKGEGVKKYSPESPDGVPFRLPDRGKLTAADVVHLGSRVPTGVLTALNALGEDVIFRYLANLPTTHRVAGMFEGKVKGYIAHQSDIYDMGPVSFVIQEAGGVFVDEDSKTPQWETVRRENRDRIRLASYGILCAPSCTKQLVDLVKVSIDFSDE